MVVFGHILCDVMQSKLSVNNSEPTRRFDGKKSGSLRTTALSVALAALGMARSSAMALASVRLAECKFGVTNEDAS